MSRVCGYGRPQWKECPRSLENPYPNNMGVLLFGYSNDKSVTCAGGNDRASSCDLNPNGAMPAGAWELGGSRFARSSWITMRKASPWAMGGHPPHTWEGGDLERHNHELDDNSLAWDL